MTAGDDEDHNPAAPAREVARLPSPEIDRLRALAQRHTTPCGSGDMVWHSWGEARGGVPPLVLLHGGSGSWTHWVRNIEPLVAAGRQIWIPDLPGFGDSTTPPTGGDADALVEPMAEGLRALFGPRPVDLVGFSFGGLTAGLTLAAHPELAHQLVVVGAPAMGVVAERPVRLKGWRHLPPAEQLDMHRYNLAVLMLRDLALVEGLALEVHVGNVVRDRMTRRRLARTDILARSLPQVTCPVHVIYGEADALYQGFMAELEAAYAAAVPDFRGMAMVADAGHWVQFERPEAFLQALLVALADGAAGRRG
jgi:2-hydroxy-6-oxonona-2,4-dienedioate hydrolase